MKFMIFHTLEPNSSLDTIEQKCKGIPNDPQIRGVASYLNLTEGKGVCFCDAPDRKSLSLWLRKNDIPFDSICPVEYEAQDGKFVEVSAPAAASAT